jgi:hypothetical protein
MNRARARDKQGAQKALAKMNSAREAVGSDAQELSARARKGSRDERSIQQGSGSARRSR